jgi:hypothetical protein
LSYRDYEDELDFFELEVYYDGRVILKYAHPGRSMINHHREKEVPWQRYASRHGRFSSRLKQQQELAFFFGEAARPLYDVQRYKTQQNAQKENRINCGQKENIINHGEAARLLYDVQRSKAYQHEDVFLDNCGTELKNFVSFYFTNVP